MESSLRLESERICFESRNLISLISNKSSHLEGMALTLAVPEHKDAEGE